MRICFLIGVFFLFGCSFTRRKTAVESLTIDRTSFGWIQRNIIQTKCMTCHSAARPAHGINLSSYATIMTAKLVVPFEPLKSLLYQSVANARMPIGDAPLTADELDYIFKWIQKGARDSEGSNKPLPQDLPKNPPSVTPAPPKPPPPVEVEKTTPTYQSLYQTIFKPKCLDCHSGPTPSGDVTLSSHGTLMDSSGTGLRNPPVVPGKPFESEIYLALTTGDYMPPVPDRDRYPSPNEQQIKALFDWIKEGAKND